MFIFTDPVTWRWSQSRKSRSSIVCYMSVKQVISNPKILILDEPTSGLDSHIAYKIFILLK